MDVICLKYVFLDIFKFVFYSLVDPINVGLLYYTSKNSNCDLINV